MARTEPSAYHRPMPWYVLKTFRADMNAMGGGRLTNKSSFLAASEDTARREAQSRANALSTAYFVVLCDDQGAKLLITEAQEAEWLGTN